MGEVAPLSAAPPKPSARALDRARAAKWIEGAPEVSLSARIEAYRAAHPGAPSAATLRRWHAAWREGGAQGLVDGRRGRRRAVYGWEARALELWRRPQRPSRATVAYWLRGEGFEGATASRVRRYLNSLPASVAGEDCPARSGRHHWRQNVGPYVPRDRTVLDVGLVYQGDGHQVDVYVQHPSTGRPWRPELVIWMDVRSRYLAGWWLSEAESAVSTLHSLCVALTRHDHVPACLHVDPGSGFINRLMTDEASGWLERAGIDFIEALPGNAKGKGDVEGWFGHFEERCGKRFDTFMQRRTDGLIRRLDASIRDGRVKVPTMREYGAAVEAYVASYNANPQAELGCAPEALWAELERSPVELPEAMLLRPAQSPVKVRRQGVTLFGRLYRDAALAMVEGMEVEVEYDVTDDSRVWVNFGRRRVCEAQLVERRPWAGASRIEDMRAQRLKGRERRLERRLEEARAQERPVVDGAAAAQSAALLAPPEQGGADGGFDPFDALAIDVDMDDPAWPGGRETT